MSLWWWWWRRGGVLPKRHECAGPATARPSGPGPRYGSASATGTAKGLLSPGPAPVPPSAAATAKTEPPGPHPAAAARSMYVASESPRSRARLESRPDSGGPSAALLSPRRVPYHRAGLPSLQRRRASRPLRAGGRRPCASPTARSPSPRVPTGYRRPAGKRRGGSGASAHDAREEESYEAGGAGWALGLRTTGPWRGRHASAG